MRTLRRLKTSLIYLSMTQPNKNAKLIPDRLTEYWCGWHNFLCLFYVFPSFAGLILSDKYLKMVGDVGTIILGFLYLNNPSSPNNSEFISYVSN